MRFWLYFTAALILGAVTGKLLFSPIVIRVAAVPDFARGERASGLVQAHFRHVAQDLRGADEMPPAADGTIHIDDRATIFATAEDFEAAQRRTDAIVRDRCDALLRTLAASCELEHLSMKGSEAPQTASLHGDERLIDVFMRFKIVPKATH